MSASTITRLQQHGLDVISLAAIEEIFPIGFRHPTEVAERAIALHALLGVIFHPNPREVSEWIRAEDFYQELTEREKWAFSITELADEEMQWRQAALQSNLLTWRAESLYVLLWASGRIPNLLEPDERMDGSMVVDHLPALGEPLQPFIREFTLRPREEILAELHYYFFLDDFEEEIFEHCAETAGDWEPMLVAERLHALQWLASADRPEWDGAEE
ncbi:DUF4272 domain-containing protein [Nocardia carnea]|uniref:DUF4272 domain-containing protein n=1 Tax=Nocardia carnea TaxID=37328 RepID=UPI0024554D81|nr:DUF4272 domain-containing protein [Nocardia carnea]